MGFVRVVTGELYHAYNRGVEKRTICLNDDDYHHLLTTIFYYRQTNPPGRLSNTLRYRPRDALKWHPPYLVDILALSLMENHFHLLIRQIVDRGIPLFISRLQDSYTKYFNTKYQRVGGLFQGTYRRKHIDTDEYFLQVVRYINLNGYVARLVEDPFEYRWSTLHQTCSQLPIDQQLTKHLLPGKQFEKFHRDYADYARSIHDIKHTLLD